MKKLWILLALCLCILSTSCEQLCNCPATAPEQTDSNDDAARAEAEAIEKATMEAERAQMEAVAEAARAAAEKEAAEAARAAAEEEAAKAKAAAATPIPVGTPEIALPKPAAARGSLTESLQKRRSIRAYTDAMISLEQLSALLWSADGINREDGKRTAPSARNRQSVVMYVTFEKGAYRYDHVDHKLVLVSPDDVRPVKAAPVEFVFTSNEENELIRGIDVGVANQNLALYCASENLATVIRMIRGDQSELRAALQLEENRALVNNMAVGFEAAQ